MIRSLLTASLLMVTIAVKAGITGPILSGGNTTINGNTIVNAGGITNGQSGVNFVNSQIAGIVKAQNYQAIFIAGDSQTVHSWGAAGGELYGGATNASTPSATTNQPDGGILYTTQTFSATNQLWALVVTNYLSTNGINVALDTAMCFSGQKLANIYGGYLSQNAFNPAQDFRTKNYGAAGVTNIAGYIGGSGNNDIVTWFPSNNDISISFTGDGGVISTYSNINNTPITFPQPKSFATTTNIGTANTLITSYVSVPFYAGTEFTTTPPYTNNGNPNNWTNNIPPSSWLASNTPAVTGKKSLAIIFAGNNDIANGKIVNASQVHISISSNEIGFLVYAKSLGFDTMIVTTPNNPNIYANSFDLNLFNIHYADELNMVGQPYLNYLADLHGYLATSGADNIGGNYMDGTHPTLAFSYNWGNFVYTNQGYNYLVSPGIPIPTGNGALLTNLQGNQIAGMINLNGGGATNLITSNSISVWIPTTAASNTVVQTWGNTNQGYVTLSTYDNFSNMRETFASNGVPKLEIASDVGIFGRNVGAPSSGFRFENSGVLAGRSSTLYWLSTGLAVISVQCNPGLNDAQIVFQNATYGQLSLGITGQTGTAFTDSTPGDTYEIAPANGRILLGMGSGHSLLQGTNGSANISGNFNVMTNLTVGGNISVTNGYISGANQIPASVTVGASPFSFVNNTSSALECHFAGGTAYSLAKNGVTFAASMVGGNYTVIQPNSNIVITYTIAPTLTTNSW